MPEHGGEVATSEELEEQISTHQQTQRHPHDPDSFELAKLLRED